MLPLMHPAAALHRQELRGVIQDDFKAIHGLLAQSTEKTDEGRGEPPPSQLTMF